MKAYEQTLSLLKTLNLRGVANSLDEVINDAEIRKHSYITFLNTVFTSEISFRVKRRVERNMVAAHFPVTKRIDHFDFGRVKGIGKSEVVNLLDCRWIDNQENVLFFGPPGIGNYRKFLFM
jgi:DNA replication protein DnaC